MKIMTIVGARPQFVKAAVVSRVIADTQGVQEVIVHTGQHYDADMSEVFFKEMAIPHPHYNLKVHGMTHGAMTGSIMEKLETVMKAEHPDMVVVYGDTDSTLAGALTAVKMHVPVAHVEAGLRSFNMAMPEEINRILTDRVSSVLFCPTEEAIHNLYKEGYEHFPVHIVRTGDVMYDAAMYYGAGSRAPKGNIPCNYILCTLHRAENTDSAQVLEDILGAMEHISAHIMPIVCPLHPRTRQKMEQLNYDFEQSDIQFMSPVGYFEMLYLLQHTQMVMTDSGGLQKEAYFFGKKCVTMREQTEWVELVQCGCNELGGVGRQSIISAVERMMQASPVFTQQLYGDGNAGKQIVNYLINK